MSGLALLKVLHRSRRVRTIISALTAVLLAFLGISIYRYASAKKKNAKDPESFSPSEMKTRKIVLIIAAVLAGGLLVIVIGFIALLSMAVAFM